MVKALQAVLAPQKVKMEANSMQAKASLNSVDFLRTQKVEFSQGSENSVSASKGKGGNKSNTAKNSYELVGHSQNSKNNVNAKDNHGNHFDSSKSSNEQSVYGQSISSGSSINQGKNMSTLLKRS
ncbi:hypothetical protein F8M41_014583 [Gigaspora margarita]|uniref:Uncharacterized protein n=1 Tax=Gigaspora margarita TaxID=4874 RepID=A0A8H4B5K7_GIGMA|nr:hypothetical protein F8M41_014583 [Gigaspora margarita]